MRGCYPGRHRGWYALAFVCSIFKTKGFKIKIIWVIGKRKSASKLHANAEFWMLKVCLILKSNVYFIIKKNKKCIIFILYVTLLKKIEKFKRQNINAWKLLSKQNMCGLLVIIYSTIYTMIYCTYSIIATQNTSKIYF